MEEKQEPKRRKSFLSIPTKIFQDRRLAVLESIVLFLKEEQELSFHEIAILLNRDDRTIWTVYNRVKKKREKWTSESKSSS
ncbi:MAG TPA: hypothetical protein VJG90_02875 [Candidatus Nanoarchaeia archaeon]|nr:hypothetical protein [Candidatus Nanoarchaeia archaeon]